MPQYLAPLDDIQFLLHDWLKITEHYQTLGFEDAADVSLINAILQESAKFAQEIISPINHSGDLQGCQIKDGKVTTPKGFIEAYKNYCNAGWSSLASSQLFGGQGLPYSLALVTEELNSSANTSWSMYPGLTHGAISAIEHHASEQLKQQYLPSMVSGIWTGTMCLTEAHCGSDLGLIRTKAESIEDGSYLINGTKIFISAGEHDLSENIIHLVLARIAGAPSGTSGISLFLVPKIINTQQGNTSLTDNKVTCSAIEHKMGIKASATCVINFDQSKGYLIGEINKGLSCMFTMMNKARLATGVQGYAIAELSRQASLAYAKNRLQMRSISGVKAPQSEADPIIVHADVKRMLFTQKALIEGCRGLAYYIASLVDKTDAGADPNGCIEQRVSLLTPICKAFMSEVGFESCNHAVQVLGGHGYIAEWQLEQQVRDARITLIYEGTNGIQALDFLGRKVLRDKAKSLNDWISEIVETASAVGPALQNHAKQLITHCQAWRGLIQQIGSNAQSNSEEIGAAAYDFLMYSGYLTIAHILLQQADCVVNTKQSGTFKLAKKQTLTFYFNRILPRISTHQALILSGSANLDCCEFDL